MVKFAIEAATRADVPEVLALIRALAHFEHLEHLMRCTEADLVEALFGERPAVEVVVARAVDAAGTSPAAGYALFFSNYSTFLGRPGLYLEDVFVQPEYRRQGCGTALLVHVARIAHARGCGRFEWSVLDWNEPAQAFYRELGASILPDWRIVRVTGDALAALAGRACPALDGAADQSGR